MKKMLSVVTRSNLSVEMNSGGNIRLEPGSPFEEWYTWCSDFIKERFYEDDFRNFDITGVKVSRVIKIHNKFLKKRWEVHFHPIFLRY